MKRHKELSHFLTFYFLGLLTVLVFLSCGTTIKPNSDVTIMWQTTELRNNADVWMGYVPVPADPLQYLQSEFSRANWNPDSNKDTSSINQFDKEVGPVVNEDKMPFFVIDISIKKGSLVDTLEKYHDDLGLDDGEDTISIYVLFAHYIREYYDDPWYDTVGDMLGYAHHNTQNADAHGDASVQWQLAESMKYTDIMTNSL